VSDSDPVRLIDTRLVRSFVVGLIAGLLASAVAYLVEHSRLAIGPYAFYGNGALIVPAVGGALALYAAWLVAPGRSGRGAAVVPGTIGVILGVGAISLEGGIGPGLLFTGLLFVLPTALVGYAVWWALGTARLRPTTKTLWALAIAGFVVAGLGSLLGIGMLGFGLMLGAAIYASVKAERPLPLALGFVAALAGSSLGVPLLIIR
jgi:hypothetical protein